MTDTNAPKPAPTTPIAACLGPLVAKATLLPGSSIGLQTEIQERDSRRAIRIKPEIDRRRAIASAVYRPCFRAFLFPFGAPGDVPPCIR
jgi:hypothetical protein